MVVVRTLGPPEDFDVKPVDPELIAKYPTLAAAMKRADKQHEEFMKVCGNDKCKVIMGLPRPSPSSIVVQIPAYTARDIAKDPAMNFHPILSTDVNLDSDSKSYGTYVSLGDAIYHIAIYGA